MVLHGGSTEVEAEAGALARGFGREEGLEDLLSQGAGNPRAGVRYLDEERARPRLEARGNGQDPRARRLAHGLVRVGDQVDDDLTELVRIGPEFGQARIQVQAHRHIIQPEGIRDQLRRLGDEAVEVARLILHRPLAGEGEEVLDDPSAPLGRGLDLLRPLSRMGLAGPSSKKAGLAEDHHQRIVELMGDPGQEVAHRGQLLCLEQLPGPLLHFVLEPLLVFLELDGAIVDPLLELRRVLPHTLVQARLGDCDG